MDITALQMLMAFSTYYAGAIDGDAGPKTWAAVRVLERTSAHRYASDPDKWSDKRRLIGAGQAVLDACGYEPGVVDGYAGHNTANALSAWMSQQTRDKPETLPRRRTKTPRTHPAQSTYPRQSGMASFYGPAGGEACTSGVVVLPFRFKLSWNKRQRVARFCCHERLAEPMSAVFSEAAVHYGETEYRRLGLDLFGGCFNHRKVRGGRALSTHAYGAAFDLDPDRNRLRWGADRAAFAGQEYEAFLDIVMANGGTPAGYAWGKDWMHFQWARL